MEKLIEPYLLIGAAGSSRVVRRSEALVTEEANEFTDPFQLVSAGVRVFTRCLGWSSSSSGWPLQDKVEWRLANTWCAPPISYCAISVLSWAMQVPRKSYADIRFRTSWRRSAGINGAIFPFNLQLQLPEKQVPHKAIALLVILR